MVLLANIKECLGLALRITLSQNSSLRMLHGSALTFVKFIVVLVDYPDRWNWPLRAPDATGSIEWRLRVGKEKEVGYTRALRKLGPSHNIKILRWGRIARTSIYKRNLNLVESQFQQNSRFRDLLRGQVHSNLGGRIAEAEQKHGFVITDDKIDIMAHYLIEELAGLWYLQFDLGYSLDFYPGQQMQAMSRIYENDFPEFTKQLNYNWNAQGFISVGYLPPTSPSASYTSDNTRTS